ncbi:NAD(P)-dependent dehydrogenase, short-chain alcohol dehydrogenase family [Amycolatopsis arida]|uniref:NAD(P)-dependent dehydrogenase, short-chain alcohol dehydrogenase family n=1 Tax=Amycolatopsis arida TaxID=587909 RepID=A0A1I5NU49_9PSEU|nr:SDR family oxidoreductase [Amycolatopsis arida]TDX98245.1 NAD(P)-dependent dehydrogenase (short-subunit alcohol dehydrogenase family) [Amycolatopsis arida]SFP25315.1 NAD(P)-dependent dehydrogenase, short-chain alcohol dehydrogenase family [Amycolatopsis arida]
MTGELDGKVAVVTGGSRGIGAAIALRLAEHGADVVITYQHSADAAGTVVAAVEARGKRALAVRADSGDPTAVAEAVETAAAEFGRLDILVNNAGVGILGPLGSLAVADIDRALAVNVRAPLVAAQAATRHMGEAGRIISIGSCVGERTPGPGVALYALSKTALTGMTRGLARELGDRGITANVVHPGPVDTDMNPADGPGADHQRAGTALGRYARPAEIAATVAYLAGPDGSYVTGATIAVDGGWTA